jgi:hypothetical protein
MKKLISILGLSLIMLCSVFPAFAATQSSTQPVQVTVGPTISIAAFWNSGANNSTINLGTVIADGSVNSYAGGATGEQLYTYSNIPIDVYTKANTDLTQTGATPDTILLSNFQYYNNATSSLTPFTTSYVKTISNWAKAPKNGFLGTGVNLQLTVPVGTQPGNYNNTIYFSAVTVGGGAPTTP